MEKNIEEIVNISKYLYNNKLVAGKAGNVSARLKAKMVMWLLLHLL